METSEMREAMQIMHPHVDINAPLTLYYDETNNIKKLHLKKGNFNVDYTANFVLGGFAFSGQKPNVEDIFDGIPLQPNVVEVKLKHIAFGEFTDCLKSQELRTFLTNVHAKPLYLHISSLNLLYYSIVDIVDSAIPSSIMHYAPSLKNALYIACKMSIDAIVPLFVKYTYPNVPKASVKDFVNELVEILEPYKTEKIGGGIKMLESLLREAANKDSLPFITDEDDYILIQGFMQLYARPIYLFLHSDHFFDNETEIQQLLVDMPLLYKGQKITNYSFFESKADKLIQASDVIIGLTGKFFKYINSSSHDDILELMFNLLDIQSENLALFLGLIEKSLGFNQGLIHYIDGHEETSKIELLGNLMGKDI
ncbi:MAG: DUF3800 domain-containing protein [Bacteroidetes bacterium]|nr:DUF3800 domain-containing protein [Bacteroidota bacterium]